jgi:hypothetical protein
LQTPFDERRTISERGVISLTNIRTRYEPLITEGVIPSVRSYNVGNRIAVLVFNYHTDDPATLERTKAKLRDSMRLMLSDSEREFWAAYENEWETAWLESRADGVKLYLACWVGNVMDYFVAEQGMELISGHIPSDDPEPKGYLYDDYSALNEKRGIVFDPEPKQFAYDKGRGSRGQDIVYSMEYQAGERYLVGTSRDHTMYLNAYKKGDAGRKQLLSIVVVNHGRASVDFFPSRIEVIHKTRKGPQRGDVFSATEWKKKKYNKAMVAAILAGVGSAYANSWPSYGSGTYTTPDGGVGTFTYTYYDSAAAASRAMHDAALWGGIISRNFEQATTGLAVAETLSPGEMTGGEIHVEKAPSGTTSSTYRIRLGSDVFEFSFTVN